MVLNCWEHKNCGREPGGENCDSLGLCPAATLTKLDGVNRGKNGGRSCWGIAGTFCGGTVQGSFCTKFGTCIKCDFYKKTVHEEGENLVGVKGILTKIF